MPKTFLLVETPNTSLTKFIIGLLQGSTTFSQNVHLKHFLWPNINGEWCDWLGVNAFGHTVIQAANQSLHLSVLHYSSMSFLGLDGDEKRELLIKMGGKQLTEMLFKAILLTLMRCLRESSTLVTWIRPALRQMDTALVDQAVEKFNLQWSRYNWKMWRKLY